MTRVMSAVLIAVLALALLSALLHQPAAASAHERDSALGATMAGSSHQDDPGDVTSDSDDRVPVMVWTVLAAAGAMALGLVLYLLRLIMGWVKPPPEQQEGQH